MKDDNFYLKEAIKEAKKAKNNNEIPVGAIIVNNKTGKIIAKGYNKKEKMQQVTKHAEIIAIEKASKLINNWRLDEYTIYTTLKPCSMCREVIKSAKIKKIIYGTLNKEIIKTKVIEKKIKNKKISNECSYLITESFKKYRKEKGKNKKVENII